MHSQQTASSPQELAAETTPTPSAPPSKEGRSYVQEKVMAKLALVFFVGVVALTLVPAPYTGLAMGIIVFLTLVAMFRFN